MKNILALCAVLLINFSFIGSSAAQTAHEPNYQDRSLWPAWVEQTDFVKEEWPKARVLVWANAGKSFRGSNSGDAENWLEDGKPAAEGPDENTDIVFPPGSKVAGDKGFDARHVTVEGPGSSFFLKTIGIAGNLWVKEGVKFHQGGVRGSRNTFCRNDAAEANLFANKIFFNKPADKSTEWIGKWKTGDELDLLSGRFIVAPGSTFMPGNRSMQKIYEDATLILLSGATFHKRAQQYWGDDITVGGALLAGTPERPLTEDARLGLSFKPKGVGKTAQAKAGDMGLIVFPQGKLVVHSADPEKARLVIFRQDAEVGQEKDPAEIAALTRGVDMVLLGDVQLNGVEFNHVLKGGIQLGDPAMRQKWQNVSFGENFAEPEALFAKHDGSTDLKYKNEGAKKKVEELRKQRE